MNTIQSAHGAGCSREELLTTTSMDARYVDLPVKTQRRVKPWCVGLLIIVAGLAIGGATVGALIATNIIHIGNKAKSATPAVSDVPLDGTTNPSNTSQPVVCTSADQIPSNVKGTWTDPTSWLDMKDFNCTYTDQTVGDLPLVGLYSTWNDSAQANSQVPALNKPWGSYNSRPFRGVSLGGWLSLEPFITPSLFEGATQIGDEYSLWAKLGSKAAAAALEKHYSTFVTEDDFKSIAEAGLDHIRIPYSYWAIKTFDDDPYVAGISWRYLLRGIEWARKYGLRVKLDLHGAPGSQNGWNHSGKEGKVDWLTGTNGKTNAQRTLDMHKQLSKFFAQDRYKNVLAFYGLINEPAREISQDELVQWTKNAYNIVHDNGVTAVIVYSESMRGLAPWAGKFTGYGDKLAIDVHEYTLFDVNLVKLKHTDRVTFACKTWSNQITAGVGTVGPTMVGEWSQADSDCAKYLNGVGNGARWTGTFSGQNQPSCPTQDKQCSCDMANADSSTFTAEYKTFLKTFAQAQMESFEKSMGWFYWTWKTESAPLWSYQAGLAGGYLPSVAYQRDWDCSKPIPSFGGLPEYY